MLFDDNRQFVEALEKAGELVRVRQEVDWDLEAGAIVRRSNETHGPAILFEKVKDYPPGYRLLGSPLGGFPRLALALNLPPHSHPREIQAEYERRMDRPIKPVVVSQGPCQENTLLGKDVDLYRLPAPMVHEGDGGRYIGTWHLVIVKDPDSDWLNWGMYRTVIWNKNHAGVHLHLGNHGGKLFFRKYVPKKEPMPIAIAIGADPISTMTAGAYLRAGLSEVDYAGGLRGKPVELVKCQTSDLLVPAHAEIVLEGKALPLMPWEGPFGEFPGYRHGLERHPVMRVEAITHRHNPILTMTCEGMPVTDGHIATVIPGALAIKRRLKEQGIPVIDVFCPPEMAGHLAVVSLKGSGGQFKEKIADLALAPGLGELKVMLVNEDIDIYDFPQVCHAFATKCHPARGIKVLEHPYCVPLTPFLSHAERAADRGARVVFDCTWPGDWSADADIPPRASFNDIYPQEIKERVLQNWKKYGFK